MSRCVVKLEYRKNEEDQALVRTILVAGHHHLPTGMESQLLGHQQGDAFTVILQGPAHDPQKVVSVSRNQLPASAVNVGDVFFTEDQNGKPMGATVLQVSGDQVLVDLNPPTAGKSETYEVHILEVRQAEESELQHNHAHEKGSTCSHNAH